MVIPFPTPPGTQVVLKPSIDHGITYQPQAVNPGFLNHQQNGRESLKVHLTDPHFWVFPSPPFTTKTTKSTRFFFTYTTWKWPSSTPKKKTLWILSGASSTFALARSWPQREPKDRDKSPNHANSCGGQRPAVWGVLLFDGHSILNFLGWPSKTLCFNGVNNYL